MYIADKPTILARTDAHHRPLLLYPADRRSHLLMIGKTGTGKSSLLLRMILEDIHAGRGVVFLDPHGQAVEQLLDHIPKRRLNDVVLFAPADREHPIGYNILADTPPDQRDFVTASVVSAFRALWSDSWGPRLEYILRNAVATLLELPNTTLLGISRLLTDDTYRAAAVDHLTDPVLTRFWHHEFEKWSDRYQTEAIAPILNKVGEFLTPTIRNIIGQQANKLDLPYLMDNRRILLVDLAKGRLGEKPSNLLGSLLITGCYLAAMARIDTPEHERVDCFVYVDEFQNFATDSFGDILSEARKFRLNLTLAHQFLDQLPHDLRAAVFGNVGSIIAFTVGADDADVVARQMTGDLPARALTDLDRHQIYASLSRSGMTTDPVRATTLPFFADAHPSASKIRTNSRRHYARSRESAEHMVARQIGHAPKP